MANIGDHATGYIGSDRYTYVVADVTKSGKTIWLLATEDKQVGNYYGGQKWEHNLPNNFNNLKGTRVGQKAIYDRKQSATDGTKYKVGAERIVIGFWDRYEDPSF